MYEITARCPIHGLFTVLRKTAPKTSVILCAYQSSTNHPQNPNCLKSAPIIHMQKFSATDKPAS